MSGVVVVKSATGGKGLGPHPSVGSKEIPPPSGTSLLSPKVTAYWGECLDSFFLPTDEALSPEATEGSRRGWTLVGCTGADEA